MDNIDFPDVALHAPQVRQINGNTGADYLLTDSDDDEVLFRDAQFIGQSAANTDNTSDVIIKTRQPDGTYAEARRLQPGAAYNWPKGDFPCFTRRSFAFEFLTNGDGVRMILS